MRYAFINTLTEVARKNSRIILLTGDLGFTVFEEFAKTFPNRFFNIGVAEGNMVGLATGLALSGKIVFTYSIASFMTLRPLEQIKINVVLHNANVKLIGSGAGLLYSTAGPTHHAVEDVSLMRNFPNMTILCPADPVEVSWVVREAAKISGPVYIRLGKKGERTIHKNTQRFTLGKGVILKKGKHCAILSYGTMVANSLEASDILKRQKIEAMVVSIHTIKPIDRDFIRLLIRTIPYIVTVEEHLIIGGIGSLISELITEEGSGTKLLRLGIPERFFQISGSIHYLRKIIGLDPDGLAKSIRQFLHD